MEGESKIDEALNLLNTAAKEKKNEISRLIADKYGDLKNTIVCQSRTMITEHPVLTISGIASGALVLGYLVGRKRTA
jgi:ElaB/YqjD/DUF883 family membrane-anchored ribosome-binding protein